MAYGDRDNFSSGGEFWFNDSELCPKCGKQVYADRQVEWSDGGEGECVCPHCGECLHVSA